MRRAAWTNGKRTITGHYEWIWSAQRFRIELDKGARVSAGRVIVTAGSQDDKPEWGQWRLIQQQHGAKPYSREDAGNMREHGNMEQK